MDRLWWRGEERRERGEREREREIMCVLIVVDQVRQHNVSIEFLHVYLCVVVSSVECVCQKS
jgi:hypothetical protein